MAFIEAGDQFRHRHHCQTFETLLAYREAAMAERDRTMFQIVVSELDREGNVVRTRPTQPLDEARETAMAMAEFDALRLSEECRVDEADNCIRAIDTRGRTFRIEVREVAPVEFAA
jgi:hypothetical protein